MLRSSKHVRHSINLFIYSYHLDQQATTTGNLATSSSTSADIGEAAYFSVTKNMVKAIQIWFGSIFLSLYLIILSIYFMLIYSSKYHCLFTCVVYSNGVQDCVMLPKKFGNQYISYLNCFFFLFLLSSILYWFTSSCFHFCLFASMHIFPILFILRYILSFSKGIASRKEFIVTDKQVIRDWKRELVSAF